MKQIKQWTLALSMVFVISALAAAQQVQTQTLPNFDFSQLHTFFVKIGTSWGNPIGESQVKDMVAQTLAAKGWTQAASEDTADAVVVVHGATQQKHSLDTYYSGMGGWGWGGMGTATTTTTTYTVGTMLIDIFDAKERKLVYRGTAEGELSEKTEKRAKMVQKALDKMFKNFPPTPKGEKN